MKSIVQFLLAGIILLLASCSDKPKEMEAPPEPEPERFLPFQSLDLEDMTAFAEVDDNWKIAGNAYVDRSMEQALLPSEGKGVLVNLPEEGKNQNLFTGFEHGDMELELDVMMPVGSNSGLYFQGRYEVQLFDSWGVKEPQHSDMGGIYQRWDATREKGKEGFEGFAPRINAAKSPGLWQHFKIIFHAPKFDPSGQKTQNASFEKVWLNGVLIQENVALSGPTRAAAFEDEKPMGPLMVQGDHGPVALRNLRYKLFGGQRVQLVDLGMKEFGNDEVMLPNLDSLVPVRQLKTDSISATMVTGERSRKILEYTGKLDVPETGDYIFDFKVNGAGGLLLIDQDTIVNLDGDYNLDSLGVGKTSLEKGLRPFRLIYNKHRPWTQGFTLYVEGPGIQKHALHAKGSWDFSRGRPENDILVEVLDEPIAQRSFLMHGGSKRTHCISVGSPQGIHYAYDLANGSMLQVWDGSFLNTTQMWHSRGEKQLGVPAGFQISLHGDPEFALLEKGDTSWPRAISENDNFKQLGYALDETGMPIFSFELNGSTVTHKMVPSDKERKLDRLITVDGDTPLWYKIGEGSKIEELPDGTFIVNDESYFVDFSGNGDLKPTVRNLHGMDELLVKVPEGEQRIKYTIIW